MPTIPDANFMRLAIDKAYEGIDKGQQPFGACVVKEGRVLSCLYNTVFEHTDVTAHPETQAVREACHVLQTLDLSGSVLYATCEPCPMCFTVAHLAKVSAIVFGVSLADVKPYGFGRFPIANRTMKELGNSPIEVIDHFLRHESLALIQRWSEQQSAGA